MAVPIVGREVDENGEKLATKTFTDVCTPRNRILFQLATFAPVLRRDFLVGSPDGRNGLCVVDKSCVFRLGQ